jgi:hypothetical protein
MEWDKVKNIQASIDRLKEANVSEEANVTMLLNKEKIYLHSISIDGSGNVIIQLDKD